jgi:peroxiredoxin/outer membrane lipoprotein-sorting protein
MHRFVGFLLVTAALSGSTLGEKIPKDSGKPDAVILLQEVKDKYTQAKFYNIESIRETEFKGDLSRQWDKSFLSAAVASGNRYRFEGRSDFGSTMKISDGKTEWIFNPLAKLYTQKPAPDAGPSGLKGALPIDQTALTEAQNLASSLSGTLTHLLNPTYLEDETLTFRGTHVPCYVLGGAAGFRGSSRDYTTHVTIWIDKQTHAVRKVLYHAESAFTANAPHRHVVQDEITVYPVADLDPSSLPESLFNFLPPAEAALVDEFPDPRKSVNSTLIALVGKPAPEVKLQTADGKTVALSEFRGKPVLLDFWSTVCAPCIASLPSLRKLFNETSDKGLVLLSVDEDWDAKAAVDVWARHAEPWPNFHDSDWEVQRAFVPGGVPEMVLIDPSGKIIYASFGFNESALRVAITKLGPEFASLATAFKP